MWRPSKQDMANCAGMAVSAAFPVLEPDEAFRYRFRSNRKIVAFYGDFFMEAGVHRYMRLDEERSPDERNLTSSMTLVWDKERFLYLPADYPITRSSVDALIHEGFPPDMKERGLPMGVVFPKGDERAAQILSLGNVTEKEHHRELDYRGAQYSGLIRVYEAREMAIYTPFTWNSRN
jgi:hypothetical protein